MLLAVTQQENANANANARRGARAKQACKICNARRVKCNVAETQPCSNCRSSNSSCEILPSRRGRYVRRPRQSSVQQGVDAAPTTTTAPVAAAAYNTTGSGTSISTANIGASHGPLTRQSYSNSTSPAHSFQQQLQQTHTATPAKESDALPNPPGENGLFFGESNLLTCVAGGVIGPDSAVSPHTRQKARASNQSVSVRSASLATTGGDMTTSHKHHYLQEEGAFNLPTQDDCLAILHAYFLCFHLCFPILDRAETARLHATGKLPPLLLQAIVFVGATYCDESIIQRIGFKDRYEAKSQLYNRARLLVEAEVEPNKMVTLQAVFLLSFRRTGPSDVKDVRYWLSVAITLAQSYGLHRSTKFAKMDTRQMQMRRRLWWSIYVRDRQSSASLGLPSRIADEDCDIEDLHASDLQADGIAEDDHPFGAVHPEHIVYAAKMVEIARLLGRIMNGLFAPNKKALPSEDKADLSNSLEQWKRSLPEAMRFSDTNGSETVWTFLLHLAYNHLHILIHRNVFVRSENGEETKGGRIAIEAACRITRIVEDMLSRNMIQLGQMHSITTIFAALCIHTLDLRRSTGIRRRLAEHRAQICLIGLKEIQKYWKINNTVLDLFFQYLDDATAKRLHDTEADVTAHPTISHATSSNTPTRVPDFLDRSATHTAVAGQPDHTPASIPLPHEYFNTMPPLNFMVDGFPDDFSMFADANMYMTTELDMQDLDMLQRCL